MIYCSNCGRELNDGSLFCDCCGVAIEANAKTEKAASVSTETETPGRIPLSDGVTLCGDGVYRWIYELNLYKKPGIFLTLLKIFVIIIFGVYVIDILASVGYSWFGVDDLIKTTKLFFFLFLGMTALIGVSYLIYAAVIGGKYCVLFEMDDKGVKHTQIQKQYKKAQILGMITATVGAAAGNVGTVGTGLLAASKSSSSSTFANVRSVLCYPRMNTIKVNQLLGKNQVYCDGKDFAFVRDYIVSRCENAKRIKG